MDYSIGLDLLLAVLLAVTIGYAMVLNRKISGLRRDRASLEKLLASFHATTDKAAESLADLRGTAKGLQAKIDTAMTLRDDLAFLVDRGTTTADRLEDSVRDARRSDVKGDVGGASVAKAPKIASRPVRQAPARPDLRAEASDKVDVPFGAKARIKHPALTADDTVRSFPNLKTVDDAPGADSAGREPMEMEPRSEAERELLKALRAARQA